MFAIAGIMRIVTEVARFIVRDRAVGASRHAPWRAYGRCGTDGRAVFRADAAASGPSVTTVASALVANPADPRDLDDFEKVAGASVRTLARLFATETGMSFGQWRRQLRMTEALALVAQGIPPAEVAATIGYASVPAFGAAFRETFGTTPAAEAPAAGNRLRATSSLDDRFVGTTPTPCLAGVPSSFDWRGLCRASLRLAGNFIVPNAGWVIANWAVLQKTTRYTARCANTRTGSWSRCSDGCPICHSRIKRVCVPAWLSDHAFVRLRVGVWRLCRLAEALLPNPAEPEQKRGVACPAAATAAEGAMSSALLERYDDRIAGVLSCYDRVVITGTLPTVCYADGMTKFLNAAGVRIFTIRSLPSRCVTACASGRRPWPRKRE
jgi:AraC-like DNA-binding protein